MTMSSHSGSPKLCANTKCKKPLQISTLSWKCPNGCLAVLCDQCSSCAFCINHRRSILQPYPARPGAPFRMWNSEGPSDASASSLITVPRPAAVQTPCLLNSSNTEYIRPTPAPTPPSRLGEKKNSSAIRSSQIRASQMIKDRTPIGIEHSRWSRSDRNHVPLSRVPLATPVKMQSITPPTSSMGNLQLLKSTNGSKSLSTSFKAQSTNGKKESQLARYMPKITDQELKEISRSLNGKIAPMFEKELTASDVGRIGRLVLPKRCAEAYFPQVSETLGEPITIRDIKGRDWDLNLRFWPNNNSRMYVLEGFNPLVKSMDLKEGDSVMFGRLENEDKLVMICRKAETASSSNQAMVTVSPHNEVSEGNTSSATLFPDSRMKLKNPIIGIQSEGNTSSVKPFPVSQMKSSKKVNIQSEVVQAESVVRAKRKSSKMGSTSEVIEPEKKEMIGLDLTSKEAQELIRPPHGNRVAKPVVIDGVKITGYKDDPIIGRPTIIENLVNTMVQWAQCDGCYKWRKVPIDIVIPAGWICIQNKWDPERSRCSDPQEMMSEMMMKNIFPRSSDEGSSKKKMKIGNPQPAETPEKSVEREAFAVISEENVPPPLVLPSLAKATTKHPRHRPGCRCVICVQPPSGTKHSPDCTCSSCMMLRRRHQTVNSRRGKKPSGPTRRKRTRRPVKTRKPATVEKTPTPQTDFGASTSNSVLMKPAAEQPASIIKPSEVGSSKSIIKPIDQNQPTKCASPANTSTERRIVFDLNVLPESDDEDFTQ